VRVEAARVSRSLSLLRLALVVPFLFLAADSACALKIKLPLVITLLLLVVPQGLVRWLRPDVWEKRYVWAAIACSDLLLISLLNGLAVLFGSAPFFFPLYILTTVEATCWWGWTGALLSGVGGALVLGMLYFRLPAEHANLGLAAAAVTLGWSIVLGYLVQWILGQWHTSHQLALQVAHQEDTLVRTHERMQRWERALRRLHQATIPRALFQIALSEAMAGTGSSLGLAVARDRREGWRVACAEGFRLTPDTICLRLGERVVAAQGDAVWEIRHLLKAPILLQSEGAEELTFGWIYVGRHEGPPYTEGDAIWLRMLCGYTALVLDNLLLRDELGRIQEQTDGLARAGWSLATLADPETALEFACRNVISALDLDRIALYLPGPQGEPGCYILTCPANGPATTVWNPLQGRGLSLLRRLLGSGAPLLINRRAECSELFEAMGWDESLQSAACFPLSIPQQRPAILCMLATRAGAFPPHVQQSLAIFCGEVALALENACLRQTTAAFQPEEGGSGLPTERQTPARIQQALKAGPGSLEQSFH
jgi:hypothetical protein